MDSTVLLGPLIVADNKLHLVTRSKVRELAATSQGVHVEEDALFSAAAILTLVLVENEPILQWIIVGCINRLLIVDKWLNHSHNSSSSTWSLTFSTVPLTNSCLAMTETALSSPVWGLTPTWNWTYTHTLTQWTSVHNKLSLLLKVTYSISLLQSNAVVH